MIWIMEVKEFIGRYVGAFGPAAGLPVAFWYSDQATAQTEKVNGCIFKALKGVREGTPVSLGLENSGCGGGKFYCGFTPMPAHVPKFVSVTERYKQTPEMVLEFIERLGVLPAGGKFLNFARLDAVGSFDMLEGLIFFSTPDVLSGLVSWAFFDNNADDAVTATFGAGCSTTVTQTVAENRKNGRRCFIGMFDPSARPHVEADMLSFSIPMSRFREMYRTMDQSLFSTHDWEKIRERINGPGR